MLGNEEKKKRCEEKKRTKEQSSRLKERKDKADETPREADEKKIVELSKEEGRIRGGAKWLRKRREEERTRGE